jgi:hypothetical protein
VNAEVGDAIEELTQLTLIPHVVAVQTDEVLEKVEQAGTPRSSPSWITPTKREHCCGQQQAARAPPQSADEDPE